MAKKKVLLVCSDSGSGTFGNMFKALSNAFKSQHEVKLEANDILNGKRLEKVLNLIKREILRWPKVLWCDAIVLHTYIGLYIPTILVARLFRKKVIVVHWDAYPVSIDGGVIRGQLGKFLDTVENISVRLATRVLIPSADFLPFVHHPDIRILPLWPTLPIEPMSNKVYRYPVGTEPLRVAFVGQAGRTRGLQESVAQLSEQATKFEIHIFSKDFITIDKSSIGDGMKIIQHGYIPREELIIALGEMDFGLISLHPRLDIPGFPSKVFDYVSAGLPVIYAGRPLPAFEDMIATTGIGVVLRDRQISWNEFQLGFYDRRIDSLLAFKEATELTTNKINYAFF